MDLDFDPRVEGHRHFRLPVVAVAALAVLGAFQTRVITLAVLFLA